MNLYKNLLLACCASLATMHATADSIPEKNGLWQWMPHASGTIRAKGEFQTERGEGRFEVRNARIGLDGQVTHALLYRAEIDLSDEGRIRMLDAYAGYQPWQGLLARIGQMRVPFSIDAHRSPHKQFFANRSFIAKQVGDVRDVGLSVAYEARRWPISLEAGVFNGSGLTGQKDFWTKSFNFSAKLQVRPIPGLTLQASMQKTSPGGHDTYLYDGGVSWQKNGWLLETEYLRKHYAGEAFTDVNALNMMCGYEIPLRPKGKPGRQAQLNGLRLLLRYDAMDDHSDGTADEEGHLQLTDAQRKRLTGGVTLRFGKKLHSELRLNYEKYFYGESSAAKPSEHDKVVLEMMVHF